MFCPSLHITVHVITICSLFAFVSLTLSFLSVILSDSSNVRTAVAMTGKFGITASFAVIYIYTAELFPTVLRYLLKHIHIKQKLFSIISVSKCVEMGTDDLWTTVLLNRSELEVEIWSYATLMNMCNKGKGECIICMTSKLETNGRDLASTKQSCFDVIQHFYESDADPILHHSVHSNLPLFLCNLDE